MIHIDTEALAEAIARRLFEKLRLNTSDPLLSRKESAAHLGVSITTHKRLEADPTFPAARRPGGGHPRWLRSELDAYKEKL